MRVFIKKLTTILFSVFLCASAFASIPSPREIYTQAKYYNALYRDFPIGIAFLAEDGTFIYANSILCNFLGRGEAELKRITKYDVTSRQDIDAELFAARRIISGEDKTYTIFKQYVHKRGDMLWAKLTVMGIYDEKEKFSHFISIVEPLSNTSFLEAEINRKLDSIQIGLENFRANPPYSIGAFIENNWVVVIPWGLAIIVTIGGIIFRIQMDSIKIKNLEKNTKGEK